MTPVKQTSFCILIILFNSFKILLLKTKVEFMGKGKDKEKAAYSFHEAKKGQKGQEQWSSSSAWNYTWSPGWTNQDRNVLTNALMKFGIGRWKKLD